MMKRDEVLRVVSTVAIENGAVIFIGNGFNARALCALNDRPQFFYMVGSMSLCPTLAAGFSHFNQRPIIVVEGDGNALMGLSGLPVVSRAASGTFIHIVLDNGLYESTGGQQTLSSQIDFSQVASGVGYESFYKPEDLLSLESLLEGALREEKQSFFHIRTQVKDSIAHPRVPYHPCQITQRFREAVSISSEK